MENNASENPPPERKKPVNRRDFFNETARGIGGFFADLFLPDEQDLPVWMRGEAAAAKAPVYLRPPGALPEPQFLDACTRCDDCVKACPAWAIRKGGAEYPEWMDNTPIILPHLQPCIMCADIPCIAVCETGALQKGLAWREIRMGMPSVREKICLTYQGKACDACIRVCPAREQGAIAADSGGHPRIDYSVCTGCGMCIPACPEDAIDIARV